MLDPVPDYDWTPVAETPPAMPYASLWADGEGLSRLAMCRLGGFETAEIGQATDLWNWTFRAR